MRRECRQHGIIRTYRILPPPLNPRLLSTLTSTELLAKLSTEPIKPNRKLWSGQVHWLRSNDVASSGYKLLTWRVLTGLPPVSGFSDLNGHGDGGGESGIKANSEKETGGSHHDDASMSFYDVGMMMMDHVLDDDEEEDGWCLV